MADLQRLLTLALCLRAADIGQELPPRMTVHCTTTQPLAFTFDCCARRLFFSSTRVLEAVRI